MKITDVRTAVVDGGWRNWVFVLVETDEGSTGYGEATLEGREGAVTGAIGDFRRHVVGEPVEEIRKLVRRLGRHGYWESGPVISSAIGGVEMALWDLLAKELGVSVSTLLGGALRDEIDVYSNAWYFGAATSDEFAQCARRTVAQGYRGLKFDPFGTAEMGISDAELGLAMERVAAVRTAVGKDVALMIEGHGRFGVESALRVARRLDAFDVRFFEEPTPPGDVGAIGRVARATAVPIAAGERAYDLRDCRALVDAGIAVFQPDVIHLGGVARTVAAADLCESASVAFAPHNASGPVATAATLQLAAVAPTLLMQEMFAPVDTEWKAAVAPPAVEIHAGRVQPLAGPGFGVSLDLDEMARHPYVARDLDLFDSGSILSRPASDGARQEERR